MTLIELMTAIYSANPKQTATVECTISDRLPYDITSVQYEPDTDTLWLKIEAS